MHRELSDGLHRELSAACDVGDAQPAAVLRPLALDRVAHLDGRQRRGARLLRLLLRLRGGGPLLLRGCPSPLLELRDRLLHLSRQVLFLFPEVCSSLTPGVHVLLTEEPKPPLFSLLQYLFLLVII